jgi:hypothetical protein
MSPVVAGAVSRIRSVMIPSAAYVPLVIELVHLFCQVVADVGVRSLVPRVTDVSVVSNSATETPFAVVAEA